MNKLNKENGDRLIDREQVTASGGGRLGVEGSSKKEKGLIDMDNSVVIAGGRGYKAMKWYWKNIIKIKLKIIQNFFQVD